MYKLTVPFSLLLCGGTGVTNLRWNIGFNEEKVGNAARTLLLINQIKY